MSGISELNNEGLRRINNILEQNPDYLRGYVNFLTDLSINTRYQYAIDVISFMKYINKSVEELTEEDFISYIACKKYKENGEEVTSSCQIKIYSALKRFSEYLFCLKKINRNFMADIKKPKAKESQKTKQKREKGFLTDEEIKIVLRELDKQKIFFENYGRELKIRDKAILYVFLTTGIRKSALRALDIESVDFKNRILNVVDKGSKVRSIYISKELIHILDEWIQARNRMLRDFDKTDALFISTRMKRISLKSIDRLVEKYCMCIDGKDITPHKLRATYGTNLYEKTHDIKFVQECMGHTSTSVTERYIRGQQNKTKEASDIMSKLIK